MPVRALCAGLPTPHISPTEGLPIISPGCEYDYEYRFAEYENDRENVAPAESVSRELEPVSSYA